MKNIRRIFFALLLGFLPALFIAGCDSTSTSVHVGVGMSYGGYYGGSGWYDPYYRYPPGYGRPVGPPVSRPPVNRPPGGSRPPGTRPPSGGRPSTMPSASRPSPRRR
jgi:hypothetical protein